MICLFRFFILIQNINRITAKTILGGLMLISILRTVVLYVFIILAIRLMGKRQISDMQPSELVVTLVVSDIASLPMQNTSQPLLSGIVPVLVLISLEIAASVLMMKSRIIRKLVCGSPVVVIKDGKLLQREMRRLRITNDDLFALLRQQDVFSLDDVQYCIVETNGTVSVLEKPEKRTPNNEQLGIKTGDNKIETVVVSDGKLINQALSLCEKQEKDVNNILSENNKSIGEVFIMTLDNKGNYKIIEKESKK